MSRRHLFGPVSAEFAETKLLRHRQAGHCIAFNQDGSTDLTIGPADTWDQLIERLPGGWRPDFIALDLAYASIPDALWSLPIPLIGLAHDWNLLWHDYQHRLARCDLIFADGPGVEAMQRAGLTHARVGNLSGVGVNLLEETSATIPRDIDILFVGNLNPAVRRDRQAWLARLARLSSERRVVIRSGVFGDSYRSLLRRVRIVFNRSDHGECNRRTFEAAASGALLFQESTNREVRDNFRECVFYDDDNLESLLEHYLDHEDERRTIADAALERVQARRFEDFWELMVGTIASEWPDLSSRAGSRPAPSTTDGLLGRAWQAVSAHRGKDPALVEDLRSAADLVEPGAASIRNALGVASDQGKRSPTSAAESARQFRLALALDSRHVIAGLNLAEALAMADRRQDAIHEARRTLIALDDPQASGWDDPHFPPGFDQFRVEWERASWANAGRPLAQRQAKQILVRWRLNDLLARWTGDLAHAHEAALARPDLASSRVALARLLGESGRPREAAHHLRLALQSTPFDRPAARELHRLLGEIGDLKGRAELEVDRRLLSKAAESIVPPEPWFSATEVQKPPRPPSVVESGPWPRVTLSMIVKNEEKNLPDCLRSVADLVDEIVIADTGSTDRTREVAASFGARVCESPWADDFAAARNASLALATGRWILWLDADDRLDEENRGKLRKLFEELGDGFDTYSLKVRSRLGPETASATLMDQARIFRNHPEIRWRYRIHEQILSSARKLGGQVIFSGAIVDHVGYQDPALRRRKLDRNVRLLELDHADHPDDPFVLFNLGWTYLDFRRHSEAAPLLRRSLDLSSPGASIVRKAFALLVQAHRKLDRPDEALATCIEGLNRFPDDAELLSIRGSLLLEAGDLAGAESSYRAVLNSKPGAFFAKVPVGIRGYKTRHALAEICRDRARPAEAEAEWRLALGEQPDYKPAWVGLGQLYLAQGRWDDLERVVGSMAGQPRMEPDGTILQARGLLACKRFAEARRVLEAAVKRHPRAIGPREILTHVLLQENRDPDAAEVALRDLLAMAPNNREAAHNLRVLLKKKANQGEATAKAH